MLNSKNDKQSNKKHGHQCMWVNMSTQKGKQEKILKIINFQNIKVVSWENENFGFLTHFMGY